METGNVVRLILFVIAAIVAIRILAGVLHWLLSTGITIAIIAGLIWLAWRLFGTRRSAF